LPGTVRPITHLSTNFQIDNNSHLFLLAGKQAPRYLRVPGVTVLSSRSLAGYDKQFSQRRECHQYI
ncbi:hypothetical protein CEXT_624311, partial [Caerostris extrusa]